MNLPQFLNNVDEYTKSMSHSALKEFIHEMARKLDETKRDDFIESLRYSARPSDDKGHNFAKDDRNTEIINQISQTTLKLLEINEGQYCLDSKYNEEWDDWYNSDVDEIIFSDPDKLLIDIEAGINLVHKCIDMELYEVGCKLSETLCDLEICADGDYNDFDGNPLCIVDLFNHNLLSGDLNMFVKESLYLTYVGNTLSYRAEELYLTFEYFTMTRVTLEDILQMGNHELPEFDDFLPLWVEYLGKQSSGCASKLLKEAQSMIRDDSALLDNARKYVNEHPELFLQILEMKVKSGEDDKMLDIGLEAMKLIPVNLTIRSKISLWTAYYANINDKTAIREKCWLEAFRSDTSINNYMRLKFLSKNSKHIEDLLSIADSMYEESDKREYRYSYSSDSTAKNRISKNEYCTILFFEQKFDRMLEVGMSVKEDLGWSSTFMKQGLALLMILLYNEKKYQVGMKAMLGIAVNACSFKKETFYFSADEPDSKSENDLFFDIFIKWKDAVLLSDKEKVLWLDKIETWIKRRVTAIMNGSKRNYYGECAMYIAAFGEVKESLSNKGVKAIIMEQYKTEYSRRRAFHEELRRYGMK